MNNRQRNVFQITSLKFYRDPRRFFVVAFATDANAVFFSGLSVGVLQFDTCAVAYVYPTFHDEAP